MSAKLVFILQHIDTCSCKKCIYFNHCYIILK